MQKRPSSSITTLSGHGQIVETLPSQKVNAKKVKVLCTMSSKDQMPQPLLASSNSQKNIQMIKALQQLNQQMIQNSLQNSNSMSTISLLSPQSQTQAFNNLRGSTLSQHNIKHSNIQLSQHQPQHFSQQQLALMKNQKMNSTVQNQSGIPLSTKGSTNVTASQIKLGKQKQTVKLQRCESHQSILSGSTPMNKQLQPKIGGDSSLSPQQLKGQKTAKHNRQSSTIMNFHQAHQLGNHQKSLSPQQLSLNKPRLFSSKAANDRVNSLDTDDNVSRALSQGSYEQMIPGESRMAQVIRISPHKQFIVHPCSTQQTSPKELVRQSAIKIQMKNSVQTKKNQNLIFEQEDYLPPSNKNQRGQQDSSGAVTDYSLNKDYHTTIQHDHQMNKHQQLAKLQKESEESINQGFITDRQQSSKNETYELTVEQQLEKNAKRTKGNSYTRNAQELKKLLLETGVIGGACLTTSLATAAAAGLLQQEMPNPVITEVPKTTHKVNGQCKVKNEIFCFSARGKSMKQTESKRDSTNGKQTCLLESNFNIKKQSNHNQKQQLEQSIQTQMPQANVFYQTLDQNINIPSFPQSTTNQIKLKEFILKDDSDRDTVNLNKNERAFQQLDLALQAQLSRRSPSSCLSMKEESNFPLYETDQFIVRKDKIRNYNQSILSNPQTLTADSHQQRMLSRCWTAQEEINYERMQSNKENMCTECDDSSLSGLQNLIENKRKDSAGKYQSSTKSTVILKSSQKRSSGISAASKNTCFEYAKNISPRSQISEARPASRDAKQDMNAKELEILKFKMIAFVKTYENQFRKMKMEMTDIKAENKMLKSKLRSFEKRKSSNSLSTNQNSQHASIAKGAPPIQFTSTQNSHMIM